MIVPPGAADETLHVLAIGPLGKVPLAALRDADGSPSIGRRPLVRVLALRATSPERSGASPRSSLPTHEGSSRGRDGRIGRCRGPGRRGAGIGIRNIASGNARSTVGGTRCRAACPRRPRGQPGHRRALRLADGDIDPAEMVRGRLAPRLAVLASCGSAAAKDEEGWGSIAAALLESGTAAVLATDRSVGDAASLTIMRDFYAQPDWRADPARALARVQRALDARAATSGEPAAQPRAWAAFSVLHRPPVVPGRATETGSAP